MSQSESRSGEHVDPNATSDDKAPEARDLSQMISEHAGVQAEYVGTVLTALHRYRILKSMAHGGVGRVYLARDEDSGREVALKQIIDRFAEEPEFKRRFLLEARTCANLEHPGIVSIYGIGRDPEGFLSSQCG